MNKETIRVFISIEFSEDIKEYLTKVQDIIREKSTTGNFVRNSNFHLTLRFIGEINNDELYKLKEAVNQTALKNNNFQVRFKELGRFSRGNKDIIWIGIKENDSLNKLYSSLQDALEIQGYSKELKKFVPHITLGREVSLNEDLNKIKNQVNIDKAISVSRISIMQTTRLNGKLTYVPLYEKNLELN